MHPNALLDIATELLREVGKLDMPADVVVSNFFRKNRELGPRERHALAETAYAVLRQRLLFTHLAQSGSGALERRLAILAWQGGETLIRGGMGPHEQTWLNNVKSIDRNAFSEKLRHNLPDWLAGALKADLGDEGFWKFVAAMSGSAPLDLRVNMLKANRDRAQQQLHEAGIESYATPYSPWGLRVDGKPALQKTDVFLRGDVEVQDEGSQLLAALVGAKRGEMVVDFCAGAGGKTLALGALMRNTGRLYAFDVSEKRLAKLKPRMARSGLSNVHPVQIAHERDAKIKRLAGKIDRVLVDAPCSGLGTLRRNPDVKWRQQPAAIVEMQAKQIAILDGAARLLKGGGRLVYATCSFLNEENDQVAEQFLANHPDFDLVPMSKVLAEQKIELEMGDYLKLLPHKHQTDGFFAAVFERKPMVKKVFPVKDDAAEDDAAED